MATVIAVDWSGRRSDDRGTWVATATDGVLTGLEPATRAHAIDCIIDAANRDPMLVAGIDFSFSLPWWVTEFHGRPPMLWQVVAEQGRLVGRLRAAVLGSGRVAAADWHAALPAHRATVA